MCPSIREKGFCAAHKEGKCQFFHNPIELDLIKPTVKMKNLNSVIQASSQKLKNMKPLEPWRPAKAGAIEHTELMDMASKKRKKGEEDEENEESPKRKIKEK